MSLYNLRPLYVGGVKELTLTPPTHKGHNGPYNQVPHTHTRSRVDRACLWVGRAGPLPRALTSRGRQKGGHRPATR
jgi:hypothetical protein